MTIALIVLFVAGYALSVELARPPPPAAPSLEVPTTDGGVFRLGNESGRVVAVAFFATWCEPCHVVESHLWRLQNESVDFVPVSVGVDPEEDLAVLAAHKEARGLPWTVAKGDESTRVAWGVDVYAHVVIVDGEGRIRAVLIGTPTIDALRQAIDDAAR